MRKTEAVEHIKVKIKRLLNAFASFSGSIEKKIVFESYRGRQYSDNPRAISEAMHALYPDYKIVWVFSEETDQESCNLPSYVQVCRYGTWRYRKEIATCFAFIRNEAMTGDLFKRKGQIFIQTWHGDRGIKKILYDSLNARGISAKPYEISDDTLTDYFVIGSDYAERRIRTAFKYDGKVIKKGCPRNDCLIYPKNVDLIKNRLGITDEKVLLYAPTLRRNSKVVEATIDIDETIQNLNKRGGEWVCLVRAHPKSLGIKVDSNCRIIDVSSYPDMSDLLMTADFLITDYSSCAGDYILTKKPLVLAQFDLERYLEEDRTFYVDIRETGYLIARTQEELKAYINTMSDEDFAKNCEKVLDYFGTCETGHAAEDVCRLIDEHYQSVCAGKMGYRSHI